MENDFDLRWIQDDPQGRLVTGAGAEEYRSGVEVTGVLQSGCKEAALGKSLDRFAALVRVHGGICAGIGRAGRTVYRHPGRRRHGGPVLPDPASPEEGLSGRTLKDVLKGLQLSEAQDVVSQARESGKSTTMNEVDFWIGDQQLRVSGEELS